MLAWIASAPALAQATPASQRANEWLTAGEVAFAQGRFGDALDAFEASYRKRREPKTLRRIGDAADKLGSHARAAEALSAYLKHVPDAQDREYIAGRIDANHAALDVVQPKTLAVHATPMTAPMTGPSDQRSGHEGIVLSAPTLATNPAHKDPAGPVWIWAAGGAVVVVGIVIAALVISAGGSANNSPEPVRGNVGSAIQTLGSR
jgi:tetratricopeptide (TPR) repeat protein